MKDEYKKVFWSGFRWGLFIVFIVLFILRSEIKINGIKFF